MAASDVLYNSFSKPTYHGGTLKRCRHLRQVQVRLGSIVRATAVPADSADYALSLGTNPLLEAVHLAHTHHLPLTLSPAVVWNCILQGVGIHARVTNKPIVASKFTNIEKWSDTIPVDGYDGGVTFSWENAVSDLSKAVAGRIREDYQDHLFPELSEMTLPQLTCWSAALSNPYPTQRKHLFTTGSRDGGVAEIGLEGLYEDWALLRDHVFQVLKDVHYDLDWWVDSLSPILEQFVVAADGEADPGFWSRIYKAVRAQGDRRDPFVHGWINVLFPYLETARGQFVVNDWPYKLKTKRLWEAPTSLRFPSGLTSLPFCIMQGSKQYDFTFVSGLMGVGRDPHTRGMRPRLGWAVYQNIAHSGETHPRSPAQASYALQQTLVHHVNGSVGSMNSPAEITVVESDV